MRSGSITLGLLIGFTVGGLVIGAGGGWYATSKRLDARHASELATAAQTHQQAQDALQARVETMGADLATCEAKVTPEALLAAGKVVEAAQAAEVADTHLRAAVVGAIPQTLLSQAVIATGSPRMIAAESAMARCAASQTTGDSARGGCSGDVVKQWALAIEAQAACPEPGE